MRVAFKPKVWVLRVKVSHDWKWPTRSRSAKFCERLMFICHCDCEMGMGGFYSGGEMF